MRSLSTSRSFRNHSGVAPVRFIRSASRAMTLQGSNWHMIRAICY